MQQEEKPIGSIQGRGRVGTEWLCQHASTTSAHGVEA